MEMFTIYEAIWRRAQAAGVRVSYMRHSFRGESGSFNSREDEAPGRTPLLHMVRRNASPSMTPSRCHEDGTPLTPDELRAELSTLAHEFGHAQSWSRSKLAGGDARASWERYFAAAQRHNRIADATAEASPGVVGPALAVLIRQAHRAQLTDDERGFIVNEESTAWRYGREPLAELRYDALADYDATAEHHVQIYRYRLGMVDENPDETPR